MWLLFVWSGVVFHVSSDNSSRYCGWSEGSGINRQRSNHHHHRVHCKASTVQRPCIYGECLCSLGLKFICLCVFLPQFLPPFFPLTILAAFWDWWSSCRQKEQDLEESQTDSGFGTDFTLEAQWPQLWVCVSHFLPGTCCTFVSSKQLSPIFIFKIIAK